MIKPADAGTDCAPDARDHERAGQQRALGNDENTGPETMNIESPLI